MSNKTLSSRGRQEAQSKRAGRFRGSSINLFYLPAVILLAVFIVYPLFSGIGLSLTNWDGYSPEKTFIGLTNFAQMFKDANFRLILINTLIYGVGSTAIQQVLGLGLALLLNSKIRGRNVFRAIIYLPALVAPVIMGTMYYFIFQYQQGALNTIMTGLGFEKVAWFNNPAVSVAIITIVNSIQFVGVSMIIIGRSADPRPVGDGGRQPRWRQRWEEILEHHAAHAAARLHHVRRAEPHRRPQAVRHHQGAHQRRPGICE